LAISSIPSVGQTNMMDGPRSTCDGKPQQPALGSHQAPSVTQARGLLAVRQARDLPAVRMRTMRPIGLVSSSSLYGSDGSCEGVGTMDGQNVRTGSSRGGAPDVRSRRTFKYSCDSSRTRLSRAS
jgi:hypothetical protein